MGTAEPMVCRYLKGEKVYLPRTPESILEITDGEAVFTAVPKDLKNLKSGNLLQLPPKLPNPVLEKRSCGLTSLE